MAVLALPQSTISRHLAYLRNAGLVTGGRRGKWMYYRLTTERDSLTHDLLELLAIIFPSWRLSSRIDRLLQAILPKKDR